MKTCHSEGPLETAVRLLARRDHTERQLREKLHRKDFSNEEITETITQLKDKGYMNEDALRDRMLEKFVSEGRYGLHGILAKLRQNGLMSISETAVREHFPEETEMETAQKILGKNFPVRDDTTLPRQMRFLCNRGFSQAVMSKIARESRKHQ